MERLMPINATLAEPSGQVIVEMARKLSVDVIVIASHARKGFMRFLKKDLAQQVLQNAPCSVFVVRSYQG